MGVYLSYMKAMTWPIMTAMFAFYFFTYAAQVASNIWLSAWSTDELKPDGSQDIPKRNLRLSIYTVFGVVQGSLILLNIGGVRMQNVVEDMIILDFVKNG